MGPGGTAVTTYRFDEPGTFEFACHLPGPLRVRHARRRGGRPGGRLSAAAPDRAATVDRRGDRASRGRVAVGAGPAAGEAHPHRPLPALAGSTSGVVVPRRYDEPVALVGRRPRWLLAVDLGPLRPRVGHARGRRWPTPPCPGPAGSPGSSSTTRPTPWRPSPKGPALVGSSQSRAAGRAEPDRRAARPGGAGAGPACGAPGRGPGRPGGGVPPQHPRDGGGPAGRGQPGGDLVVVRPRVRHPQRGRPAAPDRAGGAAGGGRLPLRRPGRRPGGRGGRDRGGPAVAAGHRRRALPRPDGRARRHRGLGRTAGRARGPGVRARAVRPPALRPVLVGHHGAAQGRSCTATAGILVEHLKVLALHQPTWGKATASSGSRPPAG